jgi:hypothetical protein
MCEMADEKATNVTVVRSFDTNGNPYETATFSGIDGTNVHEGHLILKQSSSTRAVFAPGEWKAYYFDRLLGKFAAAF